MAYNKDYYLRRVRLVQLYDAVYFEKGNHSRCHKRIWQKADGLFCISYPTYMHYLKVDTSAVPHITSQEIDLLLDFAARLDQHRKRIAEGEFPVK